MSRRFLIPLAVALPVAVLAAPGPKDPPSIKTPEGGVAALAVETTEEGAEKLRAGSANNLKQIALAFHNYCHTNGKMPTDMQGPYTAAMCHGLRRTNCRIASISFGRTVASSSRGVYGLRKPGSRDVPGHWPKGPLFTPAASSGSPLLCPSSSVATRSFEETLGVPLAYPHPRTLIVALDPGTVTRREKA